MFDLIQPKHCRIPKWSTYGCAKRVDPATGYSEKPLALSLPVNIQNMMAWLDHWESTSSSNDSLSETAKMPLEQYDLGEGLAWSRGNNVLFLD